MREDLIERLNDAWRKLYGDGDEHDVCDTLAEAVAALRAMRAEVTEWKRVASAQAELHGEAEARAEQLTEALRAERRWWADRKADAIREQVGGLTRGDPGAIARCDAAIQRIDAAIDQARGKAGGEVEGG